ncbi:MAG: hypothetical protein NTZ05_16465 [Chloroflexi bacterium]|nr:hypothetical protein [Chloroflexota bacterium]
MSEEPRAGLAEPAGWELGGAVNAVSYLAWALWLIAVGVTLLAGRAEPAPVESGTTVRAQPVGVSS